MAPNFAASRRNLFKGRQGALSGQRSDPPVPVARTSAPAAAPSKSGGTSTRSAGPSTSKSTEAAKVPAPRSTDLAKGKKKRGRDEVEVEEPRKKAPHGDKSSGKEVEKVAPQGESAGGPTSLDWLKKGYIVSKDSTELDRLAVRLIKASPPLVNLRMGEPSSMRHLGRAVIHRAEDKDLVKALDLAAAPVDNSFNMAGAHLSQVAAYIDHLAQMASSANASKSLCIGMETELAEVRGQLATRNGEVEKLKGKLKTAEENVALVVAEKDKQSSSLMALQESKDNLERKVRELESRLSRSESDRRNQETYFQSEEYAEAVIKHYKTTPAFEGDVNNKAIGYFNRGVLHGFRNLHHLVPDKTQLVKIYTGSYLDPELRRGCDFIPFDADELAEIEATDKEDGRQWDHPPPAKPNFDDVLDEVLFPGLAEEEARLDAAGEQAPVEVIGEPAVTEGVPAVGEPSVGEVAPVVEEPTSVGGATPAEAEVPQDVIV